MTKALTHLQYNRIMPAKIQYVNISELHRETGIPLSTISAILSGRNVPATNTAIKLARALGMRVEEMWEKIDSRLIRAQERGGAKEKEPQE